MTESSTASSESKAAPTVPAAPPLSRSLRVLQALREGRLHMALLRRIAARLRLRARLWGLSGSHMGRRLLALWLQDKPERQARLMAWLMHGRAAAKPVEDRLNPPRSHTVDALYQTLLAQTLWGDTSTAVAPSTNPKET